MVKSPECQARELGARPEGSKELRSGRGGTGSDENFWNIPLVAEWEMVWREQEWRPGGQGGGQDRGPVRKDGAAFRREEGQVGNIRRLKGQDLLMSCRDDNTQKL